MSAGMLISPVVARVHVRLLTLSQHRVVPMIAENLGRVKDKGLALIGYKPRRTRDCGACRRNDGRGGSPQ